MAAVKNNIHDIGLILRVGAAVIELDGVKSHKLLKPAGIKIHRHRRAQNHAVVFQMFCHTRILGQLVIHQIGKIGKRRMVLEKRINRRHRRRRKNQKY